MNRSIPFTLLFEEPCYNPQTPKPIYNEQLDISVIDVGEGRFIPFVISGSVGLGTRTVTEVQKEVTDADREDIQTASGVSYGLGTQTFTKAAGEATDSDPDCSFNTLKTHTFTRVEAEVTDEDR